MSASSSSSSLAGDVFQTLTGGLRFDRRSNGVAMDVLGTKRQRKRKRQGAGADAGGVGAGPLGSAESGAAVIESDPLDFFGARAPQPQAKQQPKQQDKHKNKNEKSKQQKRPKKAAKQQTAGDEDDEEADASDSDSDSNVDEEALDAEETRLLRKRLGIHVTGSAVPPLLVSFSAAGLAQAPAAGQDETQDMDQEQVRTARSRRKHMAALVRANVEASRYTEPTAIQMQAIPALLGGRDVLGCAPTGSGKTAAFLLPLIMRLAAAPAGDRRTRSLVVAPTRELAKQILRDFEKLSLGKRFRCVDLRKGSAGHATNASGALAGKGSGKGLDVLVCTPHRLDALIRAGAADLSGVEYIVLDEADKLLEMDFVEQVDEIVGACAPHAQRCMFSATMPPRMEELARSVLRDPVGITVGVANAGASTIDQKLLFAGQEQGKMLALRQLVRDGEMVPPTLVFVQSKERAQQLYEELVYDGIKLDVMHSERTQAQRDDVVKRFRRGDIWVLICTDLMGRGIDFKGVNCVVNYDFPTSAVSYIHRIGRTGRASRRGKAITLFTLDDVDNLRAIANVVRLSGCAVPEWMLKLKRTSAKHRRKLEKAPPRRGRISTVPKFDRVRIAHKRNVVTQSQADKK